MKTPLRLTFKRVGVTGMHQAGLVGQRPQESNQGLLVGFIQVELFGIAIGVPKTWVQVSVALDT